MGSIPFRGRALPLAFKLFRWADIHNDPEGSQNKLEYQFIDQVVALFPEPQRLLLLFDRGYARVELLREAWYLLTNLSRADSAVCWYERRFRCEELFKYIKDQLHLETIRLNHPPRIERLLFAILLVYHALMLIGVTAHRAGYHKYVCKDPISAAWMALRILNMPWLLKPRLVVHALLHSRWELSLESG